MNKKAIGKKVINSKTMNRKVIEALFEQFAVPSPQRKREFLKKYRRLEFGHLEFLVIQIWYIHWCVWVISIMLSGLMLGALICAGRDMTWNFSSVSALIPFLALLAIMEVRKSGLCRMEELELPCRISLQGVLLARMTVLGVFHFILLAGLAPVLSGCGMISIGRAGIYLLTPYLLTAAVGMELTRRIHGKESILVCGAGAFLICILEIIVPQVQPEFYQPSSLHWWGIVLAGALFVMAAELKTGLGKVGSLCL